MGLKLFGFAAVSLTSAFIVAGANADVFDLDGRMRDFTAIHGDMQRDVTGLDTGIVEPFLGIDGKPVYAGTAGNPSTTGEFEFNQWFNDTAGVNMGMDLSLTMENGHNADLNVYSFEDPEFFRIDDQLLGNEGEAHNYLFTYELHTQGVYNGGETLHFKADDDLFVFINGQLAVDIGGIHRPFARKLHLDDIAAQMGLVAGEAYDYDLFYAERHVTMAHLGFEISVPNPASLSLFGLGAGFLVLGRRRRA